MIFSDQQSKFDADFEKESIGVTKTGIMAAVWYSLPMNLQGKELLNYQPGSNPITDW